MRDYSVTDSSNAIFGALADPTRRAVLDLLRRGSLPAGRIAEAFPVSRPAVSKHLRLLRRARLVRERRQGRHHFYQLNPGPLKAVDTWLDQYRTFWRANLASLKAFVEAVPAGQVSSARRKGKSADLRFCGRRPLSVSTASNEYTPPRIVRVNAQPE